MARVLVVDDDPDILRVVEKVLRMSNHEVYTAQDAMKAMDLLNVTLFDLLITDANMPRFSGFELARTIRNNKRFGRMAVCMLTGLREKKDIEKAIRAGVDDYIVKPIDPTLLIQKISAIFAKKPPMEKAAIDIPHQMRFARSQVHLESRILHISELGLILHYPAALPDGLPLNLESDLFKKMEIPTPPKMKVISSRKLAEFEYEVSVAFVGVNDSFHQKVRAWIYSQSINKRDAA